MLKQEHELSWFLDQHIDNYLKLDLLYFLANHPHTKFSMGAMGCAFPRVRSVDLQQAVVFLEKDGLLEKQSCNETVFYRLTAEPEKRTSIIRLSAYERLKLQQWLSFPGTQVVLGVAKNSSQSLN